MERANRVKIALSAAVVVIYIRCKNHFHAATSVIRNSSHFPHLTAHSSRSAAGRVITTHGLDGALTHTFRLFCLLLGVLSPKLVRAKIRRGIMKRLRYYGGCNEVVVVENCEDVLAAV